MSLYPLGISRRRDVPTIPEQSAGSVDMRWSLAGELACAIIDGSRQSVTPMLHAAVLDAIHRGICVLPMRFGVTARDETEISSFLHDRHHELLDQLSRLDGACEMGVRIAPLATSKNEVVASPMSQSPLSYLEQRRSYYQRADGNAEQGGLLVHKYVEGLQGCYRQWRKLPSSPSDRIRLAFLVERDRTTTFQSRADSIRKTSQESRCIILGPWPPYSFVESFS
jgi:hypothetical protein